jgi:hypothetical protein
MLFFLQRNTALLFFVIAAYATSSVDVVSGICVGNGVGQTCDSSLERPNIACCVLTSNGASFNACCSDDFGAVGVYKNTKVGDDVSQCSITGTGVGCTTTDVPDNDASTQTDFMGLTPCKRVGEVQACLDNSPSYNYGYCENNADSKFDVCCVGTNTGTYAPGDSCIVTLPSISKDAGDEDSDAADLADLNLVDAAASTSTSASATAGIPTSISSNTGVVVTGAAAVTIVTTLFFL